VGREENLRQRESLCDAVVALNKPWRCLVPHARSEDNGFAIEDLDIKADWWAASLLHRWQAMGLRENSVGE